MDSEVVQTFNKTLVSMYDAKPPISKQKIFDITKAAMNAIRYFKHVVFIVEKFLVKCRTEYKISGLYVIDSIVRQARKQYQHKDVFAPRFAINLQNTFANILSCDASERPRAVRVINLWLANKIFDEEVIEPLLQHCRAMGLEVDTEKVELIVKGEKANMQIYGAEASLLSSSQLHDTTELASPTKKPSRPAKTAHTPRTPPLELRPKTPPESSFENSMDNSLTERDIMSLLETHSAPLAKVIGSDKQAIGRVLKLINDRITERLEIERRRQGNIKNLLSREFDYSDEEDDEENRHKNETSILSISKDHLLSTARSLLLDNSLINELQTLRQEIVVRPHRHPQDRPKTPPPMQLSMDRSPPGVQPFISGFGGPLTSQHDFPPPGEQLAFTAMPTTDPNKFDAFRDRGSRKRGRSRSNEKDHDYRDSRQNESSADDSRRSSRDTRDRRGSDRDRRSDRKQRRSRSPSIGGDTSRNSSRYREREERDRRRAEEERERERERERRRNGLPTRPKDAHVLIASRTLWFGRIPSQCTEAEIIAVVKDVDVPERINIVAPRACAYVTMRERRSAFKIIDRHDKEPIQMQRRNIKLSWATITGLKDNEKLMDYWDVNRGVAAIPYSKLPENLDALLDGAHLDVDTLPDNLKGMYDSRGLKGRAEGRSASQHPNQQPQQDTSIMSSLLNSGIIPGSTAAAPAVNNAPNVQPNVFSQVFPQPANLPGAGNMFQFQSLGMPPSLIANPAAVAAVAASNSAANGTANIVNGGQQQPMPVAQSQQQPPAVQNTFNAAALAAAGMAAFAFPPPGVPQFPSLGNQQHASQPPSVVNVAGVSTTQNPFLAGAVAPTLPFTPPGAAPSMSSGSSVHSQNLGSTSGEQFTPPVSAFPNNNSNFQQQFGQNQQFGGSNGRGGQFGAFHSNQPPRGGNPRGGRFPQRGGDSFRNGEGMRGRGNFGRGGGEFNRFDPSRRGRGNGSFRGDRGGGGPRFGFRQEHGFENNENDANNNGFGGRFGSRGGNFGRGGPRGFRGGAQFQPRFPPSGQHSAFAATTQQQQQSENTASNESNEFDGVDSLFADNRVSDFHQAGALTAQQQQNNTPATNTDDDHQKSSPAIPDIAKLSSISIPNFSATTISNLREIIGATNEVPVETTKLGGMDEYDDEDDENYFKALGSRSAALIEESEPPVSTTQTNEANTRTATGESARMDEEVSSTTASDESEHRAIVSTSAERSQPLIADEGRREEVSSTPHISSMNAERQMHSSSSNSAEAVSVPDNTHNIAAIPRFGRDVPTDAVEVQVDQSADSN